MSIFAAVREQHPDWDDEAIYKEANLIYAEKTGGAIQVVDPSKPPEQSAVIRQPPEEADGGSADEENDLQDTKDPADEEQANE